ncbi:MAG: DUF4360 domain-containing protein [Chitinophagaceae bacterium]|nr:DUF4360 domain-containing protein [Oligoflexus sp.]
MNGTLGFCKFVLPALLSLSAVSAFAEDRIPVLPPAGSVKIKSLSAIGSGCPDASTYSTNISDDAQAFTVTFSSFVAEVGPGIPLSASRKNCALTATLQIPAGYQFSIATFNYRGFMDLDSKVQAEHTTQYYFQGQSQTGKFVAREVGPKSKDFVYTDTIGLTSVYIPDVWSPCNIDRALIVNPSIRVSKLAGAARDAQGLITNDSVDGELKQVFGFVWRQCAS